MAEVPPPQGAGGTAEKRMAVLGVLADHRHPHTGQDLKAPSSIEEPH